MKSPLSALFGVVVQPLRPNRAVSCFVIAAGTSVHPSVSGKTGRARHIKAGGHDIDNVFGVVFVNQDSEFRQIGGDFAHNLVFLFGIAVKLCQQIVDFIQSVLLFVRQLVQIFVVQIQNFQSVLDNGMNFHVFDHRGSRQAQYVQISTVPVHQSSDFRSVRRVEIFCRNRITACQIVAKFEPRSFGDVIQRRFGGGCRPHFQLDRNVFRLGGDDGRGLCGIGQYGGNRPARDVVRFQRGRPDVQRFAVADADIAE